MHSGFLFKVILAALMLTVAAGTQAQTGDDTARLEVADQYVLVGAITGDDSGVAGTRGPGVALIKHTASGRTITRQKGQEIGGWIIEHIESDQIVITRDGQKMLIRRESFPAESQGQWSPADRQDYIPPDFPVLNDY